MRVGADFWKSDFANLLNNFFLPKEHGLNFILYVHVSIKLSELTVLLSKTERLNFEFVSFIATLWFLLSVVVDTITLFNQITSFRKGSNSFFRFNFQWHWMTFRFGQHHLTSISISYPKHRQFCIPKFGDAPLVNLAVAASLSNQNRAEMERDDEANEDDSPKHCALYSSNGCKYKDPSFKRPRKTLWMECSFPSYHSWHHEVCILLKFKTEEEREAYTLIYPKHSKMKEQFLDKLRALSSDKHSLQDENTALWHLPQQLRNPAKTRSAEHGTDYSKRPNYVRYEGQYFHMAEFLSLQYGKLYRPSASWLSHWIDSARNDFYAKAFEFVNPQRVATWTYLYDIVAMWLPSEGLHVGHIIRIIRSPSLVTLSRVWVANRYKSQWENHYFCEC